MHLYLQRNGNADGPYPAEQVEMMIAHGELAATELAAAPGDPDWKPLSHWIPLMDETAAAPASTPPPIPPQAAGPDWDAPFSSNGKPPSGTEGKTMRQVCEQVANGGRFIIYPYVVSIIILSFRRSSPMYFIPPGSSGAAKAIPRSILSMLVGWWGIPWGIFFTISALWRNAAGGIDVTLPVIASSVGLDRANALLSQQPKPPAGGLWLLRGIIATPLILLGLMIFGIISNASSLESEKSKLPGYAEYREANSHITRTTTTSGKGDGDAATRAAQAAATIVHEWFKSATTVDPDAPRKGIAVWCELGPDRALFLIKIPELRSFDDDSKNEISHAAWIAAQLATHDLNLAPGAELAVAVRGAALYDRMLVGTVLAEYPENEADAERALLDTIVSTERRLHGGEKLAAYFAPPEG